ncbi:uncharacterized protein BO80DRAFT_35899 [Aspergillus ibericus CBS 121593]|uniref:Uncharacterized protein n=1 Tax=Aspergillus ibericus CBS 121593 TaxID=1448316 RepID=A0A395H3K1_9EURO|nr:hypothetical protein BO80DRAFT_35899 [Aspergillus ibericus CBS 121593]RAL02452.1 hypothetical protein BO80DRAFT_35899 [Aspergillus ibericus CBS 121593]
METKQATAMESGSPAASMENREVMTCRLNDLSHISPRHGRKNDAVEGRIIIERRSPSQEPFRGSDGRSPQSPVGHADPPPSLKNEIRMDGGETIPFSKGFPEPPPMNVIAACAPPLEIRALHRRIPRLNSGSPGASPTDFLPEL